MILVYPHTARAPSAASADTVAAATRGDAPSEQVRACALHGQMAPDPAPLSGDCSPVETRLDTGAQRSGVRRRSAGRPGVLREECG